MQGWSHPVGAPGLIALLVGVAAFVAVVLRRTVSARRGERISGASNLSRAGIVLQAIGFAFTAFGPVRIALSASNPAAIIAGLAVALLLAATLALFVSATRAMGRNWSMAARMRDDHQLVRSGIFARLRHPIYLAMTLYLGALALALGHFGQLILGAPFFLLGTAIRIGVEERLLRERFGSDYLDYARSVKRFIPGLF
jgi:protein-S-isoprenylcysteine O-methyltransferase Ste14